MDFFFQKHQIASAISVALGYGLLLVFCSCQSSIIRITIKLFWIAVIPLYFVFEAYWVVENNINDFGNYKSSRVIIGVLWLAFIVLFEVFDKVWPRFERNPNTD